MVQDKRHYEVVFLVQPDQSEHINSVIEHQKTLVTDGGGLVHRVEDWGRIHLCYPINKIYKAHYVLMNIECCPKTIEALEKWFKFNDAILRKLVISVKQIITAPSIMLESIRKEDKGEKLRRKEEELNKAEVNYKDLSLLKLSIMENGRLIPARISGTSASRQRKIAHGVKIARYLALLPYCDRHK
jgi:small subunit ribosomal protein S6